MKSHTGRVAKKMWHCRGQRRHLAGLLVLLALNSTSCKKRGYNGDKSVENATISSTPSSTQPEALDVNDVSILFPLPESSDQMTNLLALTETNSAGAPIITDKVFNSILEATKDHEVEPGVKVRSGIVLTGKRTSTRIGDGVDSSRSEGPFDFTNKTMWRVVGVRFDPCGPRPDHNLLTHPSEPIQTSFSDTKCNAQLRLTAQPVMKMDDDFTESRLFGAKLGDKALRVADYALHLTYVLEASQAKALAKDLLNFKQACHNVTSDVPMGTHPCLQLEKEGALKSVSPAPSQQVFALVRKYATQLASAAFMGTDLSLDPWVFFIGTVSGDDFHQIPIGAVRVPGASQGKTADGKRIPFGNGWFQMITFVMAAKPGVNTVVPLPAPAIHDNAAQFLKSGELQNYVEKDGGENASERSARVEKMKQIHGVLNRIDDPTLFDPFSTDCVSCHKATALSKELRSKHSESDEGFSARLQASAEAPNRFAIPSGVTSGLLPLHAQDTNYDVVNFGYFVDRASISRRVANESAFTARMTNEMLGLQPNSEKCEVSKLQDCLDAQDASDNWSSLSNSMSHWQMIRATTLLCLKSICPEKAKAKKEFFGSAYVLTFKSKTIFGGQAKPASQLNAVEKCEVAAGTKAYLISPPEPSGKFSKLKFLTRAGNCPLYGPGGEGYVEASAVQFAQE